MKYPLICVHLSSLFTDLGVGSYYPATRDKLPLNEGEGTGYARASNLPRIKGTDGV